MSLISNLTAVFARIGTEIKAVRTLINGNNEDLSELNTTDKTNLVNALNETLDLIGSGGGATIDDEATSTTTVWSSQKTSTELTTKANATHTHAMGSVTGLQDALDGKAPTTHTHTPAQVTGFDVAALAAVPAASPTIQGKVELATNAETAAGTDSTRAVTPAALRHVTGDPETDLVTIFEDALT